MIEDGLGLFAGKYRPSVEWGWAKYENAKTWNQNINLYETVRANENFFIGK